MAAKKVLVPIGTGSEEMEAVITIDVLRRAGEQQLARLVGAAGPGGKLAGCAPTDDRAGQGTHSAVPVCAGAEVTVASVESSREVECARKTRVLADKLISDCAGEEFDLIALPVGGLLCAGKRLLSGHRRVTPSHTTCIPCQTHS